MNSCSFLVQFYDPSVHSTYLCVPSTSFLTNRGYSRSITSILICRFILSLRQFDSTVSLATFSAPGSRSPESNTHSMPLELTACPSDGLPPFIASFAHPVHANPSPCEAHVDSIGEDSGELKSRDIGAVALPSDGSSRQSSGSAQPSAGSRCLA